MIEVVVFGICGKMGKSISKELVKEDDVKIIGGFDKENIGEDLGIVLNIGETGSKIYNSYKEIERINPDLIIDFTKADIALKTINWAIDTGINIIVGTTGISKENLVKTKKRALKSNSKVFIAPNFSVGAVIMIKISKLVAKYFDNCEIIELHHDGKIDSPSGTSISTAEQINEEVVFNNNRLKDNEVETVGGSRGSFSNGIHIHSVRLPGLLAHQNVIFGAKGQTLSIRHDSIDRSSFYPGVIHAIRSINNLTNYTYGLDSLINI
jgi:4-hydroxy-tetrahydrodipicolinate reductase